MTLRELVSMAEGRMEFEGRLLWEPMSVLLSMTYNANRDPKKSTAKQPDDFNPYRAKKKRKGVPLTDITMLKALVPNSKRKK